MLSFPSTNLQAHRLLEKLRSGRALCTATSPAASTELVKSFNRTVGKSGGSVSRARHAGLVRHMGQEFPLVPQKEIIVCDRLFVSGRMGFTRRVVERNLWQISWNQVG